MRKIMLVFSLGLAAIFMIGASGPERPKLSECGNHLPAGAQYRVDIEGSWDRRPSTSSWEINVSYQNDDIDSTIDPGSAEVKSFQACVSAAIGRS